MRQQREGSPFTGLATVALKEAADHMTSARIHLVMLLVLLTAVGAVYAAIGQITETVSQDQFLFLRLFTTAREPLPSFVAFLGFLLPLVAIALGFDSINGEYNRRTMSRILSQPIYRDALLTGKFLGGLLVIAICLLVLWLLVTGLGILLVGLPPSGEEVLRGLAFLLASFVYAGVWLAVALVFSTLFRSPATSALATLTVWLLFTIFWPMLAPLIAGALVPVDPLNPMTAVDLVEVERAISRISPNTLFGEMTLALLNPETRSLGIVFSNQLSRALIGAPLPVSQSLMLIWPQLAAMIAALLVLFTAAYVSFQRQEIRA
ncbi:ABC transporter permease [Chelativorans sp. SCAU2101]|jgi:ABC-type transport system involved in multi-copper enzyme maturation, permease component|uniref:ABC transporter permease n=1 Tax=Chelativorans petroleitrophicus TaxID=2975484 RepID=A0A9X2X6H6_9HYPH|nr:ABC transporter permease [Chelativorans petroleitrophicus]MCT8989024.1 ABC transporter permease [Chelativorans petroleitrophicus]